MATFTFFGKSVNLPAAAVSWKAETRDKTAWQEGVWETVKLDGAISALRVHTDGTSFPGRPASAEAGAWVLIGDVIQTAAGIASSRSLPTEDPGGMTAFTHTSEATVGAGTVLNIGLASSLFWGSGGGFQAEYVSGPPILFRPLAGSRWHNRAGMA